MLELVNIDMFINKRNKKLNYKPKKIKLIRFRKNIKIYLTIIYVNNIFFINFKKKKLFIGNIFNIIRFYRKLNKKYLSRSFKLSKFTKFNIKSLKSLYSKLKRVKTIEIFSKRLRGGKRIKKVYKVKNFLAYRRLFWTIFSLPYRIHIFRSFMEKISFYFYLKKKKLKNLNKVNIFDIYLKLKKKLIIKRQKFYILKITSKISNTYVTLIDSFGKTIFVCSAGRVFVSEGGSSGSTRKGFGVPKSEKLKRHKKLFKDPDQQQEVKNPKNKLRSKKRRKAKNTLKQILQVFIKKLINLKIFDIKILEVRKNSRRNILIVLRYLFRHGVTVQKCVNYNAHPHNNSSGIKFKKMPRK